MKTALSFDDIIIVPKYSTILSRSNVNTSTCLDTERELYLDIPLIASPMDTVCEAEMAIRLGQLGGLGVIHRFCTPMQQYEWAREVYEHPQCSAVAISIGVSEKELEGRARRILAELGGNSFIDIICIDVAHGDHCLVENAIKHLRGKLKFTGHIMAGNVATAFGAVNLAKWGANSIRVGIGNGSLCSTRLKTGVGIPQVTALQDIVEAIYSNGYEDIVTIVSDGGHRMPGDVAKSLALGAHAVMIGSIFAGTKESPGAIKRSGVWPDDVLYKEYRGSASLDSKLARGEEAKNVEGASQLVHYRGKVRRLTDDIMDGVRSSMSYVGSSTISDFRATAEVMKITNAGMVESDLHGLRHSLKL
tara:strand:- start:171 stop:1253 length:1083 start_codon:yes stop_codon:yes gene_type:complete